MLNGFWTVTFSAATDMGAGVVAVINNRAMGGDAGFTYIGPLSAAPDGAVSGELQISRHSNIQPPVIPGLDNYVLLVSGKVAGEHFELTGKVKGQESMQMAIRGKKVSSI